MKSFEHNDRNEVISVMINIFTRVVALIFLVVTVSAFITGDSNNIHFSIKDVLGILLMGFISGVSVGLFYIKKNLTARTTIILHIIYFFILNIVLGLIGISLEWFEKNVKSLIGMEIMFVVIYFAVLFLVYIFDLNETKKINQKLHDRNKKNL